MGKNKSLIKPQTIVYLVVIIILALIPRVWDLKNKPPINVDEVANTRDIQKILDTGKYNPLNFHWDFSKTQLVYAPALIINSVLGGNKILMSLRLTSVLFSILALIPFFHLVKSNTTRAIS